MLTTFRSNRAVAGVGGGRRCRLLSTLGRGGALAGLVLCLGCSQSLPDRNERMTRGYLLYLDGAGGGGELRNYSAGLKKGMLDAGYDGAGEMFPWQTGLGLVADQDSSVAYKRSKAAEAARRIRQFSRQYPHAPITLIGMSAGTAVAVFTLEALPSDCEVQNVVLLSASLSEDYDLTRALQHVRERMYVTVSQKDSMLGFWVRLAGTADRQPGTVPSGGLSGFQMPAGATSQTRREYSKLVHIRWAPEFSRLGDEGGHFDTVNPLFIQVCIAPLIMRNSQIAVSVATRGDRLPNPDFERWRRFPAGSWETLKGYQALRGKQEPLCMTATLIHKQADMLIVERQYIPDSDPLRKPVRIQGFLIPALIDPSEHPFTSPTAKISELPIETITLAGKALECRGKSVQTSGEFPEYGRDVLATVYENEQIPGGMTKVWLKSHKGDDPFEFRGELAGYGPGQP